MKIGDAVKVSNPGILGVRREPDRDVLFQLLTTNKSYVNYGWDGRKKVAQPAFVANKRPTDNPKTEIHEWYGLPADWKWTAEQPIESPKLERASLAARSKPSRHSSSFHTTRMPLPPPPALALSITG